MKSFENVRIANVYGTKEAKLYANLIQRIIKNSCLVDGVVRIECTSIPDVPSTFYDLYVDFISLSETISDEESCKILINMEIQRDHISRLKH